MARELSARDMILPPVTLQGGEGRRSSSGLHACFHIDAA